MAKPTTFPRTKPATALPLHGYTARPTGRLVGHLPVLSLQGTRTGRTSLRTSNMVERPSALPAQPLG